MSDSKMHLAEINVARARFPLDDPRMAGFVAQLDVVNGLADASPGFVWRLQSDGGGASSYVRAFDDERLVVNLSVWRSIEALKEYTYRSHEHAAVFRNRFEWFEPVGFPSLAMWWILPGQTPTIDEAKARLELIGRIGPSPDAFTFKQPFAAPRSLVDIAPA